MISTFEKLLKIRYEMQKFQVILVKSWLVYQKHEIIKIIYLIKPKSYFLSMTWIKKFESLFSYNSISIFALILNLLIFGFSMIYFLRIIRVKYLVCDIYQIHVVWKIVIEFLCIHFPLNKFNTFINCSISKVNFLFLNFNLTFLFLLPHLYNACRI